MKVHLPSTLVNLVSKLAHARHLRFSSKVCDCHFVRDAFNKLFLCLLADYFILVFCFFLTLKSMLKFFHHTLLNTHSNMHIDRLMENVLLKLSSFSSLVLAHTVMLRSQKVERLEDKQ